MLFCSRLVEMIQAEAHVAVAHSCCLWLEHFTFASGFDSTDPSSPDTMDATRLWTPVEDVDLLPASDEAVLLEEALVFIGDLDFEVETPMVEDDKLSRLMWEEVPEPVYSPPVLPTMSIFPSVVQSGDAAVHEILLKMAQLPSTRPSLMQPVPAAKPQPAINKTRTRRREELIYLRGLVGDLEQRLSGLRTSPKPATPEYQADDPGESGELLTAWEEIAGRQAKQRAAAEMENIKLRRLLEDQIQVGKSLERLLLKKRPCLESAEAEASLSKRLRRTNSSTWNRARIFDELLADCAAQYAQTSTIVAHFKDYSLLTNRRDVGLVHDPVLGLTLQTNEFQLLPFDYVDTTNEMWSYLPTASTVHRIHEYHDVHATDDTLKFQFRVTLMANGTHGDFSVKMVTRRFVEENRTVIVMSGFIESSEISDEDLEGVRVRLTAWHVIEPIGTEEASGSAATKVISHLLSVPEVDADQRDRARKVGTLTDFLLATIAVEMESRSQQLENRLLQQSFDRHRAKSS